MKYVEYGTQNPEIILMLHGGGLNWWNYKAEAEALQSRYHVILPTLDGHAGSDCPFTSIESNAEELLSWIDENASGSVFAICGLSLGAQILVELLSRRKDICRYAVIESALVIPMPLTRSMISPAVSMSYGLIEKPWFSRMQFEALNICEPLYADYYRDSCGIKKADMIAFLRANSAYALKPGFSCCTAKTLVLVGGKEQKQMISSAQRLHAALSASTLEVKTGYTHGELSLNHAPEYLARLDSLLADQTL